jgi:hypothetical protein
MVSISDLPLPFSYQGKLKHSQIIARWLILTMNRDAKNRSLFSTPSISSFKGVQYVIGFVAKVSC